jgi:regulator of G-protein signaling 3/regulator of G-protein signaling
MQVNLDSDTRSATAEQLSHPHLKMFDVALFKINHLMEKDSFPRFLKSDLYADAVSTCKK